MKTFLTLLLATLCAATSYGQTMKALMFNTTNGQVVANAGTNVLTFVSTTNQPFSPVKFRNWDSGNEMQIVLTDEGLASGYSAVRGSIGSGGGDFQIKYGNNSTEWGYPLIFASIGDGVWQTVSPASTTNDSYRFNRPISFNNNTNAATTRTNLGLGSFNSDNGFSVIADESNNAVISTEGGVALFYSALSFSSTNNAATTRTNLGLGATWLTNTNAANFRNAIGLGVTNGAKFSWVEIGDGVNNLNNAFIVTSYSDEVQFGLSGVSYYSQNDLYSQINIINRTFQFAGNGEWTFYNPIAFNNTTNAAATRTNLSLGATNNVAFRNITSDGNIVITNQTATNNGLLFIYRTNNEPFLGLANLIASNNTTISNETLFRVGVAEATNQSAQFGFRSTNTNGSGVAVFSVFGYNALMMVGADASTNAVIFSGGGTNNEVMTLIRDGATEFARPIRFSTNASTRPATNAPATNNVVAAWVEMRIGTNSYRVPLYQ